MFLLFIIVKTFIFAKHISFMEDVKPQDIQPAQAVQVENPVREFINVDTAEHSRLNRGINEDIFQTRELKKESR